ncbi:MAG: hypothetical protein IPK59_08850 [Rhodospirillaceae bacterium]|nr:hypothetical protein [Rhodospirillaceae bacterium]
MGVAGGIFNIIQRGQFSAAATASQHNLQPTSKSKTGTSTDPLTWSLKRNESAVASYWRLAPESAARNAPRLDIVKRLEKMADGNNSDISAEKLRQAKMKLEGLRRQLQMLAASGDVRQLRRIGAEAASLAREIGSAARNLAQGIGASGVSNEASGAQATASAATAAAQTSPASAGSAAAEIAPRVDTDREALEQSYRALHDLGSDARNAVVQAKGIIALAAQIAKAKRRGDEDDDDRFFRRMQEMADAALGDIDAGQREALGQLIMPPGDGLDGGMLTDTSLEITIETVTITETRVEIYA